MNRNADRKKSTRQSKAWDFGDDYIAVDDPEQYAWRCRCCIGGDSMIFLHNKSISPAVRHLRNKHHMLLEDESSDLPSNTRDGPELPVVSSLIQKVNVEDFRYYLLRWIVNRQVAFIEVDDRL